MAITRGVSWALATCTAISSAENKNTRNDSIEAATMPSSARDPFGPNPNHAHPVAWSNSRRLTFRATARTMAMTGTGQIDWRTLGSRWRRTNFMAIATAP